MPAKSGKRAKLARRAAAPSPTDAQPVRDHVVDLLRGGHAHMSLQNALADWPAQLRGTKPQGQPFTAWRLLEHIRISQWDIVEFTKSSRHQSPEWPDGYWPPDGAPPTALAWDKSIAQVERDLKEMERIVADPATDLYARIPHGTGQTVLREALVLADHNSYHLGQLVLLKRLLGVLRERA